jgi:hypothetical protein
LKERVFLFNKLPKPESSYVKLKDFTGGNKKNPQILFISRICDNVYNIHTATLEKYSGRVLNW